MKNTIIVISKTNLLNVIFVFILFSIEIKWTNKETLFEKSCISFDLILEVNK